MGSDSSPDTLYEAVCSCSKVISENISFDVFLTQEAFDANPSFRFPPPSIHFYICDQYIRQDEFPLEAIRNKPSSTLVQGILQIKKHFHNAFISCGNTGALIAACALYLPRLKGIKRPALLATLPSSSGNFIVLDVGSTVLMKEEQILLQALMGAVYAYKQGKVKIRIGFLNIGKEDIKGSLQHQKVHNFLKKAFFSNFFPFSLEYLGNVEAMDAFQGKLDVLVTDGFTGNIFLKTAEATAELIFSSLEENKQAASSKIKEQFDFSEHLGAIVTGIENTVVKCHGRSTKKGLEQAIKGTYALLLKNDQEEMKELLSSCLTKISKKF